MPELASSLTFVDPLPNVSLGKVWRGGSIRTSWHTLSIRFVVVLLKWLCLNETKLLFLHDKLCWRSLFASQLHIFGKQNNGHPYCIFRRSQNFCFDKLYLSFFSGRVDNHVDAPFTWLISFKQILLVDKSISKLWGLSVLRCSFFLILFFNFANSSLLMLYSVDCSKCSFFKDSVLLIEFWHSVLAISPIK